MNSNDQAMLNGGCACNKIRYAIYAEPGFSFHCPCRDCQQATGTGHSSSFICNSSDTEVTGELTWYERTAPSGNTVFQGFCSTCGSPVMNKNSGYPDKLFIAAGNLDDPSLFNPQTMVHRDSKLIWDFTDPEEDSK